MRETAAILADIRAVCSAWSIAPGPSITLLGAEPFSHPDLPELVTGARDAGCQRIRLRTDGGALGLAGNAAGALHAGVRQIELVLLGGDEASHDSLAGREGLFGAALAGITAFRAIAQKTDARVVVTGLAPLCRHTAPHLTAAVVAFARAGAVSVLVEPVAGYAASSDVCADALRAATVSGVALHGAGMSPFSAEPWIATETQGPS